ncbi:uncharacterized protein LOC108912230 [Anoplophora glabripennis]|uniref:uncharacterized protein LOC108912230 n=1 Tax=Anoplophora glabripennis TaxID=217634 RepID=UPI000873C03E|nr:uncharacterized protein LOC108912230 [Anoplophora glabripennis]
MTSNENPLILMTVVPGSRSSMTPSPSREIRGIRLFRVISRKLARRSNEELHFPVESDSRSSSSDSCSSTSTSHGSRTKKEASGESVFRCVSPNHISSSSSDAGSDIQQRSRHHHSTSAESIRKVFQNLNLNVRSQSCNNTKEKRKSKKPAPKRILRQPVTYTYVKGLSGLPTQRIPKDPRIYNSCCCSMQYMAGLNR